MKQVLQNLRTGETEVAEVPAPTPGPGTALVRTAASVVSAGTERMLVDFAAKSLLGKARARPDLVRQALDKARREGWLATAEAALQRLDQPMPLGYSSAGTVAALGEGVHDLRVGQRVACAGGGHAVHAEYAVVPRNLIAPLPPGVGFESAAFTTLGAIAMHGFRLGEVGLGARVAVIGLGLLGLLGAEIASAAGCHVLGIDLAPERVRLAERLGAQAVLRSRAAEAALSFSRGRGCDAVLIFAATDSSDPIELAGEIARDRARVIAVGAVGLEVPRKVYFEKELTLLVSRSYGPGRYDPDYEEGGGDYPIGYVRWTEGRNLEAFVDLLATGRMDVEPLITHRFPVEHAPDAYNLIADGEEPSLGVLLTYPQAGEPQRTIERLDAEATRSAGGIRLGVLGAGNFATNVLLPAIQKLPGLTLVGIAAPSGTSAGHAAEQFDFRYATSDPERVLDDPEVNAIAVLTRHHLHVPQTVAALSAGRHVFCEKPLAITPEGLAAVEEALTNLAVAQAPPALMVGFNRRFAPLARSLASFLEGREEPLVAHYRVNAGYLPPDHWLHDPEQGGGRLVGEACHFVDFLAFLVGEPPKSVRAFGVPDSGRDQGDNFVLTCTFPDGSLGTVAYLANGDRAFPKERVEVFTAGRVAVLDDFRALETVRDGRRRVQRSRLRQDKGHRAAWEAFVEAIRSGGPPPIPYRHLLGVTEATFAARESLRTGETVPVG